MDSHPTCPWTFAWFCWWMATMEREPARLVGRCCCWHLQSRQAEDSWMRRNCLCSHGRCWKRCSTWTLVAGRISISCCCGCCCATMNCWSSLPGRVDRSRRRLSSVLILLRRWSRCSMWWKMIAKCCPCRCRGSHCRRTPAMMCSCSSRRCPRSMWNAVRSPSRRAADKNPSLSCCLVRSLELIRNSSVNGSTSCHQSLTQFAIFQRVNVILLHDGCQKFSQQLGWCRLFVVGVLAETQAVLVVGRRRHNRSH